MTEWEKAQAGYLYDANYDSNLINRRTVCADLCYEFNLCRPSDVEKQQRIIHELLGQVKGNNVWIGTQVSVLPGVTIGNFVPQKTSIDFR